jgi:hypothetical protein
MALVVLAMGADLVTFTLIVPLVGIGVESNGLMARAYIEFGLGVVAALKLASMAVVLLLVARCWRINFRLVAAGVGIAFGVLGTASNLAAFVRWMG